MGIWRRAAFKLRGKFFACCCHAAVHATGPLGPITNPRNRVHRTLTNAIVEPSKAPGIAAGPCPLPPAAIAPAAPRPGGRTLRSLAGLWQPLNPKPGGQIYRPASIG